MTDQLLVMDMLNDNDLQQILILIDPSSFDEHFDKENPKKGMLQMKLDEPVKLQVTRKQYYHYN